MLKFYLNNNKSKPGTYKKNIEKNLPQKNILLFLWEYFANFFIMLKFYLNNNKSKPGTHKKNIEKNLPQKNKFLFFMGIFNQYFYIA